MFFHALLFDFINLTQVHNFTVCAQDIFTFRPLSYFTVCFTGIFIICISTCKIPVKLTVKIESRQKVKI